ncbi:hypothetical protein QR680_018858 [Steinernema hermaphroditum]|uniref:Uncharacterized protein n=1 Tax=Steinernema hermaphroditum TaxID=289476 RepID=A0AA39HLH0_9BILA|nr:hypothetical protein QR680_018858 [Steinernema hermaphroditum]
MAPVCPLRSWTNWPCWRKCPLAREQWRERVIPPMASMFRRPSNCRELTKKEKQTERELSPPQFVNTADAFGIRISRRKKVDEEREDQRRRDAEERIRAAMAPSTVAAPDSDTPAQRTYLGNFERALDISEPITVQPPRPQRSLEIVTAKSNLRTVSPAVP